MTSIMSGFLLLTTQLVCSTDQDQCLFQDMNQLLLVDHTTVQDMVQEHIVMDHNHVGEDAKNFD